MSPYFYYAIVTFIFPASAFARPNGDVLDISINDEMARLTAPFSKFEWLPNKLPEVTDPMFKIMSPLHYFKITANNNIFVPYEPTQDGNMKEIPKGPKYEQRMKERKKILNGLNPVLFSMLYQHQPVVKEMEKAGEKLSSQRKSNGILDFVKQPQKTENTKTETQHLNPFLRNKGDLMGADENTPYENIYDWAMKKLGYEIDRNVYIPNVDFDDLDQVPDTHNKIEEDNTQGAI